MIGGSGGRGGEEEGELLHAKSHEAGLLHLNMPFEKFGGVPETAP